MRGSTLSESKQIISTSCRDRGLLVCSIARSNCHAIALLVSAVRTGQDRLNWLVSVLVRDLEVAIKSENGTPVELFRHPRACKVFLFREYLYCPRFTRLHKKLHPLHPVTSLNLPEHPNHSDRCLLMLMATEEFPDWLGYCVISYSLVLIVLSIVRTRDPWTPLHEAARKNDLNTVQSLLNRGVAVDLRKDGNLRNPTPLSIAAQYGHDQIVRLLLENGADVTQGAGVAQDPLLLAAVHHQKSTVEMLLAWRAQRSLHFAVLHGDLTAVAVFLSQGVDVNGRRHENRTPLHFAVLSGDRATLERLIVHGADVNAQDLKGHTPLMTALKQDQLIAFQTLLDSGGRLYPQKEASNLLHEAARSNAVNITDWLVSVGYSVNQRDLDNETPLHSAARMGSAAVANFLIKNGAELDVANISRGRTPLHCAISFGRVNLVQILVDGGADINAFDKSWATPLLLAEEGCYEQWRNIPILNILYRDIKAEESRKIYLFLKSRGAIRGMGRMDEDF
ncbi:ankyrin repeat-containing protein [Rubidibacter lacunae KORDI 51-2]|uniref:Ankyrin repeat-containing protein n=1 Tax=Rubidibacter lacunae KORDI 51-2 TaxID=582515 RepID=U5DPS5_9CHRO|nr:ankyrin repeat domain-containing protein [Rubidibacter lacunae]ERN41700.1 ankyrin repeat-containing protein [Rubidibacter lacunae KORDI 51-2]